MASRLLGVVRIGLCAGVVAGATMFASAAPKDKPTQANITELRSQIELLRQQLAAAEAAIGRQEALGAVKHRATDNAHKRRAFEAYYGKTQPYSVDVGFSTPWDGGYGLHGGYRRYSVYHDGRVSHGGYARYQSVTVSRSRSSFYRSRR